MQKSDQSFALSLVSLTRNIKKAVENHEFFAENIISPAELLMGRFTGIEVIIICPHISWYLVPRICDPRNIQLKLLTHPCCMTRDRP